MKTQTLVLVGLGALALWYVSRKMVQKTVTGIDIGPVTVTPK